jgi:hypothetical protein
MSVVARGKLDDGIENTLWWLIRIWEMSLQSFINTGRRKESQDRLSGSKRLFYFLSANLCFYIPNFVIFSARWVHVIEPISDGMCLISDCLEVG